MLEQTNLHSVRTSELAEEPYGSVLCYPTAGKAELEDRIRELASMGVVEMIFEGKSKVGRLGLLGKGCVSIVVKAMLGDKVVALKIRRIDADRPSMEREATLLELANGVGVGPKLHTVSRNFLTMDVVNGVKITEWMSCNPDAMMIRNVVLQVLEQCFRLDSIGLDHGELSNGSKHMMIGSGATIIDFESASTGRRVANVTSAAQYLLIGSPLAARVRDALRLDSRDGMINCLRKYKDERSRKNFESLLELLR